MKKWYTTKELSDYLGISKDTVYKWVKANYIPYYKIGRLIRFDIDKINIWLKTKFHRII